MLQQIGVYMVHCISFWPEHYSVHKTYDTVHAQLICLSYYFRYSRFDNRYSSVFYRIYTQTAYVYTQNCDVIDSWGGLGAPLNIYRSRWQYRLKGRVEYRPILDGLISLQVCSICMKFWWVLYKIVTLYWGRYVKKNTRIVHFGVKASNLVRMYIRSIQTFLDIVPSWKI